MRLVAVDPERIALMFRQALAMDHRLMDFRQHDATEGTSAFRFHMVASGVDQNVPRAVQEGEEVNRRRGRGETGLQIGIQGKSAELIPYRLNG